MSAQSGRISACIHSERLTNLRTCPSYNCDPYDVVAIRQARQT